MLISAFRAGETMSRNLAGCAVSRVIKLTVYLQAQLYAAVDIFAPPGTPLRRADR